ncbi:MAG: transposase [Anaerolineales bacterium]
MSMITPVLIVTPEPGFGSLIKKGLDAKRFEVFVTVDFSEAIRYVRKVNCPVAILDAALDEIDISILDIGYALRQINTGIQFIVVAPEGQEPKPGQLAPLAALTKPVSVSEIEKLLERIKTPSAQAKNPSDSKPIHTGMESETPERDMAVTANLLWLKDVSKAAQHLTQLTLESSAQAALITRENELWAYAGQLSREAAQELGQSIQRYWDKQTESDLLRFVRLEATDAQHMLYARKLSASMILALVFDAETPFSTIRAQAGKLVRTLAANSVEENIRPPEPVATFRRAPAGTAPLSLGANAEEDENPDELPPISALLGDVPPPIPVRQTAAPKIALPWEQPKAAPARPGDEQANLSPRPADIPRRPPASFSRETSPVIRISPAQQQPNPAMDETRLSGLSQTATEAEARPDEIPPELRETRKQQPGQDDIQAMIETRAQNVAESVTDAAHRILLEPASPALVNLTYACLLVPRFDHHHLVGDAADRLTEWVPQVCIAFGWRLEHLAVRPEYLQWVVRVPPSTAPGYLMRIVRQQTSERLFNEFARFKTDNPSGDFWAPGYLIMGSSQPHPQKLVRDFVHQTRERQGLAR